MKCCADWCAVEILLKIERREEWKERKEEKRKKKITLVNNNNQADNRHQNQSTLQQDFQTKPKLFLF
jgi:hypothetical protein